MNSEAGPSSQPTANGQGANTPMEVDPRPIGSVFSGEPTSRFKGKGKDIDWDAVRTVNLGSGPSTGPSTSSTSSTSSTRFLALSPIPSPSRQNPVVTLDQVPTRRRTSRDNDDSSNLDTNSSTTLPMGRPLPDPTASQPPAKRFRPLGPTPLPPGPPTVQHLRILLEPEHVDMNRPRQFFDYLRKRDGQPPRITLSPAEIKEILDKMKRINEIWLRTMGEDEACVQCIAEWLREFMRSKNPKMYEGIVSPAIWVILKAKPPLKILKSSRFGTLAQQCLGIAKNKNLSKKDEIEKAVKFVEQMLESLKKTSGANPTSDPASEFGPTTSSNSSGPANSLLNFKRTDSSSTLPNDHAQPSSTSTIPNNFTGTASGPVRPPSGPDLSKLLASIMPAVKNLPKIGPTAGLSQRPPPMPMVRPSYEPSPPGGMSYRPPPSVQGAGASMAFRPVEAPTPMVIKREPGLASSAANAYPRGNAPGSSTLPPAPSGSRSVSYPGDNNRWSSVATPAGRNRPFDDKKRPNYRNHVIRYRDEALAEARFFAQDEGEEEWDPYWWAYGKLGKFGRSNGNMDRDEGHTMKHLHGHEPAIEWYDPSVYDTQVTTVHPVHTAECQDQDQRERPILAAYYRDRTAIPPTPDESNVRIVQAGYGTTSIPELPRAYIPRPQPLPPQMAMYNPPPPPQQSHQSFGNAYRPREVPSNSHPMPTATSSSFRPRNPPPAPNPAPGGTSSSYRPRDRGASAPAPLVPKQDPSDPPFRRASTPGPGGNVIIKAWESDSSNPAPTLDLQGTIRYWRREMRPKRPALLNPLTPQEIAQNMAAVINAPPFNYEKCELEGEEDKEAEREPGPAYQG